MERQEFRLECLKLAHRHDRDPAQVVALAKEYEKYVRGTEEESVKVKHPDNGKNLKKRSGNVDILS